MAALLHSARMDLPGYNPPGGSDSLGLPAAKEDED